jgi:hypothetical protein
MDSINVSLSAASPPLELAPALVRFVTILAPALAPTAAPCATAVATRATAAVTSGASISAHARASDAGGAASPSPSTT